MVRSRDTTALLDDLPDRQIIVPIHRYRAVLLLQLTGRIMRLAFAWKNIWLRDPLPIRQRIMSYSNSPPGDRGLKILR
jgi:hypothetical protein